MIAALLLAAVLQDAPSTPPPRLLADWPRVASGLHYAPNGSAIVTRTLFGIAILDASSGHEMALQETPDCCGMVVGSAGMDVSRNGRWAAFTTNDSLVVVEIRSGRRLRSIHMDSEGGPVAFSPDGRSLVVLTGIGNFWVLQFPSGRFNLVGRSSVSAMASAFSPNRHHLVCGGYARQGEIEVWDVDGWTCSKVLKGPVTYVSGLAFSPDGRWMASGSGGHTVILWDAASWVSVWQRKFEFCCPGYVLAFSPDGRWLATGGSKGTIVVLDVGDGRIVRRWVAHGEAGVRAAAFSPDGRRLATSGFGRGIRIWDMSVPGGLRGR